MKIISVSTKLLKLIISVPSKNKLDKKKIVTKNMNFTLLRIKPI